MKARYKIFLIIGILLLANSIYALRISRPKHITEFNESAIVAINENFERLWELTNGRFNLNIVTTNPDGTLLGKAGDMVIFNNSGTYYLAINVNGSQIWRSILLTDVP